MDVNNDGILEAKGIQVQDTIRVKNIIVEDNIKSASLTLNNQNFTTNNNNISAGIDGITTTTNDRIDFSKNIQLNAGKTITGDTANFTSINLDGNNLATQLTKISENTTNIANNTTKINENLVQRISNDNDIISTKIDHFTINPTNINITNKDFLVNELPTGSTTGTTNIQLKTNGDVISKKLQSDNIINTNNLTTKSINVETISQKQTDGTYKSFDLNNLTTTTNNTTTTNADNLINDTNNSAPLFVDTKSVHMNRNLSLNHNTIENLKGLEFTTTQSPSISYTLNDETIQINKNSLPSTIILSSASDTKIKAKEIEGVDGKFTNLYLNGSIFNPSTSSGTISGITSDSINGLTFSTKSKFEKKLTTLSDYNLSNKITNDATNGLVITGNESTFEKLNVNNYLSFLENLSYTPEVSNFRDLSSTNIASSLDILYNKKVDASLGERILVRKADNTNFYQNFGDNYTDTILTSTVQGTSVNDVAVKIKDIETNLQTKTNHIVQNFTGGVYLNTERINNTSIPLMRFKDDSGLDYTNRILSNSDGIHFTEVQTLGMMELQTLIINPYD
eukprot:jgi/Bigna1/146707/aug1.119_g21415